MELFKIKKLLSSLYSYKQYFSSLDREDKHLLTEFVENRKLVYDFDINDYRYTHSINEELDNSNLFVIDVDSKHWIDYLGSFSSHAINLENKIREQVIQVRLFPE